MLLGIGDGGGAADENGVLPIEPADPHQPPDDVGQVGAEDPPIDMELVDNDVFQIGE